MRLTAKGRLEKSYKAKNYKGVLEIAVGERILFLENNWLLGVKNGSRGTITNINMQNEEVKSFNVKLDNKDMLVRYIVLKA